MTSFTPVPVQTLRRLALEEERKAAAPGMPVHESMTLLRKASVYREAITLDQANRAVAATDEPVEQMPQPSAQKAAQVLYWGAIGFLGGFALTMGAILATLAGFRF